ncbi:hypothetical protein [Mesorhizobium australicum]|uniref:hypothetical protein n=1 Tax=Mesorhizobium australicum TaxID=536018 RepID=UPI00059AF0CF|nr:hypothetical protein [Mesorhizobium australicum]
MEEQGFAFLSTALRLLDEAQAGTCRQSIAFEAFVKDMVVSDQPSEGLNSTLASSIYDQARRLPGSI